MKDKETTLKFGLPKNEAKVYITLLRLGLSPAGQITKTSGIHRRNVYDALERLVRKGFVGYVIKDKVKHFEATNPYLLLNLLEKEKEKLKNNDNLSSLLSELLQIKNLSDEKEDSVIIFKGIDGVKSILEDVLNSKENLVLGAHKPPEGVKNYLDQFHKRRIKLGIKEKLLFNKNDVDRAKRLTNLPFTKIRFLPKNTSSQTAVNIYDDRVAILMWSKPVGVLIKSENVANTFREYFKLLWKISK